MLGILKYKQQCQTVAEPSSSDAQLPTQKLAIYKSPGIYHTPAAMTVQSGGKQVV